MRPATVFPNGHAVRGLRYLAGLLILKVTASVLLGYQSYFPPDFRAGFLNGRDAYYFGGYQWAFLTHIVSGPLSLVLGLALIVGAGRGRVPRWHRLLGRVQVTLIVMLVAPSGLWMARYAAAGPIAGTGLAVAALLTAGSAMLGAWQASRRRFAAHQCWMWRCYLLLCSAVVIRLIGGMAWLLNVDAPWFDPLANWLSWLVPLAVFETAVLATRNPRESLPAPRSS